MQTSDGDDLLRCADVTFGYRRDRDVIKNLSFNAQPSDVIWCVGDNGSGKTTLAKLLSGIEKPTSGRLAIRGREPSLVRPSARVQLVFVVQQRTYLGFVRPTLRSELRFAARRKRERVSSRDVDGIIHDLALAGLERVNPFDLSYTEAWRAALAIGTILDPLVLFVDELPNLCSRRIIDALRSVIALRASRGRVTLIAAHAAAKGDLPITKTIQFPT
jgi:energy-coupling factor transporter ATP-binding protein EcfA2